MADAACSGHTASEVEFTSSHPCPPWLSRVSRCLHAQDPHSLFPILPFLPQAVDPASLGRSSNCWGHVRPSLLKGAGAVRVEVSNWKSGSVYVLSDWPIHQPLGVDMRLSLIAACTVADWCSPMAAVFADGIFLYPSNVCSSQLVSSLHKKLLSYSETVTLLWFIDC